jgi:hypothetical protein
MTGFRARVDCTDPDPGTGKREANSGWIGRAGVRPGGAAGRTPSLLLLVLLLLETTVELHSDSESAEGSSSGQPKG